MLTMPHIWVPRRDLVTPVRPRFPLRRRIVRPRRGPHHRPTCPMWSLTPGDEAMNASGDEIMDTSGDQKCACCAAVVGPCSQCVALGRPTPVSWTVTISGTTLTSNPADSLTGSADGTYSLPWVSSFGGCHYFFDLASPAVTGTVGGGTITRNYVSIVLISGSLDVEFVVASASSILGIVIEIAPTYTCLSASGSNIRSTDPVSSPGSPFIGYGGTISAVPSF